MADNQEGSSMLDVEKIKAAGAQEGEGKEQQGEPNKADPAAAEGAKGKDGADGAQKAERPDWLKEDKFWDADKGEMKADLMFKNLQELQAKFSRGDHKAPDKPEGYKVGLDDKAKEALFGSKDADPHKDPLFQKLTGWGVKHKISQDALNEILGQYAEASGEEVGKFQIDVAKERQALGKNADAVIQNQHQFFEQMFKNGEIGEAELKEAGILFETAAGVKLMQAIRARYGEQPIPIDVAPVGDDIPSSEELGKMIVDAKYGTDKSFTDKVDGWYKKRYGTAPAMSSVVNR